jgi:hypothetical protein
MAKVYEKTIASINQQALVLFGSMQGKIQKRLISKVVNYDQSNEECDYETEAFMACRKAVCDYCSYLSTQTIESVSPELDEFLNLLGSTEMTLETYAYWLAQKWVYALAGGNNSVCWSIVDKHGVFVELLYEREFRKNKSRLQKTGHTFYPQPTIARPKSYDDEFLDAGELADPCMQGFELLEAVINA